MTQLAHKAVSGDRVASEFFAQIFQAYMECSDTIQAAIRDMVVIVNAEDATDDEREAAIATIEEALFPKKHDGELGIDLEVHEKRCTSKDVKSVINEMNAEEASFAERLIRLMEVNEMTQSDLASAIGVGQSAIAMMIGRTCRPQRRTVEKIAQALKVSPEELWPGIKQE